MPTKGFAAYSLLIVIATSPAYSQPAAGTVRPTGLAKARSDAEQAYKTGRHDEAIRLTNSLLSRDQTDHLSYYVRASARVELGFQRGDMKMIRAGIADSRKAIEHAQKRESMYYLPYLYGMTSLSRLEQRPSHAEVSIRIADQIIEKEPNAEAKANLFYQRARANDALRKPQDAISDYKTTLKLNKLHLAARTGLADALEFVGDVDQALEVYRQTAERFPNEPLVFNNRGMLNQRRGKHREAINDFMLPPLST